MWNIQAYMFQKVNGKIFLNSFDFDESGNVMNLEKLNSKTNRNKFRKYFNFLEV